MVEMTSSGLTEGYDPFEVIPTMVTHSIWPEFYWSHSFNKKEEIYYKHNFGQIDVTWDNEDVLSTTISLKLKDTHGQTQLQKNLLLRDLSPATNAGGNFELENCEILSKSVDQRHMEYLKRKLFYDFNFYTWFALGMQMALLSLLISCANLCFFACVWLCYEKKKKRYEVRVNIKPKLL